jgi:predicted RNase H-like HicB family nuclease
MMAVLRCFVARVKRAAQAFESDQPAAPASIEFIITLEPDELDGGWVAECRDLPGCVSQGETQHEALENILDAIGGILTARMERQLPPEGADDPTNEGRTRRVALTV